MLKSSDIKIFLHRSICFNNNCNMYSSRILIVGECYDIYESNYQFSHEFEIFKDGYFYTSFIASNNTIVSNLYDHFYTESKMREITIDKILK